MSRHPQQSRNRWPDVNVISGWVFFNGGTQMGFALSTAWEPGKERRACDELACERIQHMNLPLAIVQWMHNLFYEKWLTSVSVQQTVDEWRVHLSFQLDHLQCVTVVEIVNRLLTAAGLPHRNPDDQIADICTVHGFTQEDALAHWLGGCIRQAVQQMFEFSTR